MKTVTNGDQEIVFDQRGRVLVRCYWKTALRKRVTIECKRSAYATAKALRDSYRSHGKPCTIDKVFGG